LTALSASAFVEKKDCLLDALDEAVQTFISINDFADIVRQSKAMDNESTREMIKMSVSQLSNEANLLMRYPEGKPTMIDRLREKFGPNYTYRDGDGYNLPLDELLDFEGGLKQPGELNHIHDKKNKVHHIFF
jgi:hypothetical protein